MPQMKLTILLWVAESMGGEAASCGDYLASGTKMSGPVLRLHKSIVDKRFTANTVVSSADPSRSMPFIEIVPLLTASYQVG